MLDSACKERELKIQAGVGVLLPDDQMLIPDVTIYRVGSRAVKGTYIPVADVILAVEVVSHSSRRQDRTTKPELLAASGVPLHLIVDPFPQPVRITLYQLDGDSHAQAAQAEAGIPLRLPAPFDLDLDTAPFA